MFAIKAMLFVALILGGLVDGSPYRRGDMGLRIPLQPQGVLRAASSKIELSKSDSVTKKTVRAPGFTWGADPMRGVNIGGW